MSTPDDEPGERGGRDRGGQRRGDARRLVLGATAVLAAIAAGVVVWSDDARLLRLGVVAALWATMLVVVTLLRRPADPEALRRTYEAELAGEVAARREHELTVEQTLRRELERERGGEIEALRSEVERLRTALEQRGPEPVAAAAPAPPPEPRLQVVNGLPATPPPPSRPPRAAERPPEHRPAGPGGPGGPGLDRPPLRPVATPPEQHPERPLAARRFSAGPGEGPGVPLNGSARARGERGGRSGDPIVAAPYASWEPAEVSEPQGLLPQGSFVDHYLGAAGHDPHVTTPAPGGAANRMPPEAWRSPDTTGRTVAELLAAHAAASEPHRRRRGG